MLATDDASFAQMSGHLPHTIPVVFAKPQSESSGKLFMRSYNVSKSVQLRRAVMPAGQSCNFDSAV